MAHISSESDRHVESLLRLPAPSGENLTSVEIQQIDRRNRHRHGWVSKAAAFPLVRPRYYLATVGFLVVHSILLLLQQHKESWVVKKASSSQKWTKPEHLKVIALIFYGRPETVSILDCYMKQNLVSNGGLLDEVHWAVNTDN